MREIKQNTTANEPIFMTTTDHVTGATALTLTVALGKDGGAFTTVAQPAVTEIDFGWYNLDLTSAHTDTTGIIAFHVTATAAADPTDFKMLVNINSIDDISTVTPSTVVSLSTAGVAGVWDEEIEGTLTARHIERINLAALAGESTGGGSTTIVFQGQTTTIDRITANVNSTTGNRKSVTLNATSV